MAAKRFIIEGKVQGVFMRATAKEVADENGIRGWVRNLLDGTVEIHAEGNPEQIEIMEKWCNKGTPMSQIETVRAFEAREEGLAGFEIRL